MTVWIIAVLMSTVATAGLLLPLVWRRNRGENSAAYDIEVYKDQLNQVGQDYDRRLLSAEQAQAAKTEISRRLLQADTRLQVSLNHSAKTKPTRQIAVIALVALIVPLGALSFYSYQGAPGIAGMPFAERTSEQPQTARSRPPMNLEAAATQLRERLTKNPNDLRGWLLLARTYVSIQQFPQAVSAFEKALSVRLIESTTASWEFWYGLLEQYKEEHGDCLVPNKFQYAGINLGNWVGTQRNERKKKRLSEDRIALLEALGFVWDPTMEQWEQGFSALEAYKREFGNCLVTRGTEYAGIKLGSWVDTQRNRKNRLSEEQIARLDALGFVWNALLEQWEQGFSALEAYKKEFGNCLVPAATK